MSAFVRSASKFRAARSYTASAYGSVRGGNSTSARDTRRKLSGLPSASARASSVLTTSYGTAAIRAASCGRGRSARNGWRVAMGLKLCHSDADEGPGTGGWDWGLVLRRGAHGGTRQRELCQ